MGKKIGIFGDDKAAIAGWERLLIQTSLEYELSEKYSETIAADINILVGKAVSAFIGSTCSSRVFIIDGTLPSNGVTLDDIASISSFEYDDKQVRMQMDIPRIAIDSSKFMAFGTAFTQPYPEWNGFAGNRISPIAIIDKNSPVIYTVMGLGKKLMARGYGPSIINLEKDVSLRIPEEMTDSEGLMDYMWKILCFHEKSIIETINPTRYIAIRIDVDYFDPKGIQSLEKVFDKYKIKATWFVNVTGEEGVEIAMHREGKGKNFAHAKTVITPDALTEKNVSFLKRQMNKQHEIGNHGFQHWGMFPGTNYPDIIRTHEDIILAQQHLEDILGFRPTGYATPGGLFDPALLEALNETGISYSTEWGRGTPYFPIQNGKKSNILQIPCPALCVAYMTRKGKYVVYDWKDLRNSEIQAASKLLEEHVLTRVQQDKPVILAIHPHEVGPHAEKIIGTAIKTAIDNGYKPVTFNEIANKY